MMLRRIRRNTQDFIIFVNLLGETCSITHDTLKILQHLLQDF